MKKYTYIIALLFMLPMFTSCEKNETPVKKNQTSEPIEMYEIVVETINYDEGELKNDAPNPVITMEGILCGKKFQGGNRAVFDLKKGESYDIIIKSNQKTWFRVYTYVTKNGITRKEYNAGSCPGTEYRTFGTRRY